MNLAVDLRAMGLPVELVFSLPPAGLRRNHETTAWGRRNALKDAYSKTMYDEWLRQAVVSPQRIEGALEAFVVWRQCGEGDVDNTLAALKPLFDNLGMAPVTKAGANRYYLGIYESDSQIRRITVERERVSSRDQEEVSITLRRYDP